MISVPHLKVIAAMLLWLPLAGCVSTAIVNDVPPCEQLIPAGLIEAVPGAEIPEVRHHDDGHEDAQPWQEGWFAQSVQLERANERPPAIDHIYRTCLNYHRSALARSRRGFLGRLFGG